MNRLLKTTVRLLVGATAVLTIGSTANAVNSEGTPIVRRITQQLAEISKKGPLARSPEAKRKYVDNINAVEGEIKGLLKDKAKYDVNSRDEEGLKEDMENAEELKSILSK